MILHEQKKGLLSYDYEYINLIHFLNSYHYAVELVRKYKIAKKSNLNSFQTLHFTRF